MVQLGMRYPMNGGGVQSTWDKALEGVGAGRGLECVVDSLEAWRLLVNFVDPVVGESQGGMWLTGVGINAEELGDGCSFASVFL